MPPEADPHPGGLSWVVALLTASATTYVAHYIDLGALVVIHVGSAYVVYKHVRREADKGKPPRRRKKRPPLHIRIWKAL